MNPDVKFLVDLIRSNGFQVEVKGKHAKVFRNGETVLLPEAEGGGPVVLPTTPSDARWRKNLVRTLIRARVLEKDPWAKVSKSLSTDKEVGDRARAAAYKARRSKLDANRQWVDMVLLPELDRLQKQYRSMNVLLAEAERISEDLYLRAEVSKPLASAHTLAQKISTLRPYRKDGSPKPKSDLVSMSNGLIAVWRKVLPLLDKQAIEREKLSARVRILKEEEEIVQEPAEEEKDTRYEPLLGSEGATLPLPIRPFAPLHIRVAAAVGGTYTRRELEGLLLEIKKLEEEVR